MVIGAATSSDGRVWACAGDGPAVEPEDIPGGPDLHSFVVTAVDGAPLLLVEALLADTPGSDLWLLTTGDDPG
jgi:hypothetical protein